METTIYLDMIFLLQGITHCTLIYISSKLSGYIYKNILLLILGGFTASLCHVIWLICFFPKNGGLILSIITVTIGILISFNPKTITSYIKILMSAIFSSFLLGGALNVMFMVGKTQQFLGEGLTIKPVTFPWYYLIWGTCTAYLIIKKYEKWIENHITKRKNFCSIILNKNSKSTSAYGLIDTGNSLTYENQEVIIIEFTTLMPLFTKEECEKILQGHREFLTPFSYSSLGNPKGVLWGIKVDECIVCIIPTYATKKITSIHKDFWIGIHFDGFTGGFDAVVPVSALNSM